MALLNKEKIELKKNEKSKFRYKLKSDFQIKYVNKKKNQNCLSYNFATKII